MFVFLKRGTTRNSEACYVQERCGLEQWLSVWCVHRIVLLTKMAQTVCRISGAAVDRSVISRNYSRQCALLRPQMHKIITAERAHFCGLSKEVRLGCAAIPSKESSSTFVENAVIILNMRACEWYEWKPVVTAVMRASLCVSLLTLRTYHLAFLPTQLLAT